MPPRKEQSAPPNRAAPIGSGPTSTQTANQVPATVRKNPNSTQNTLLLSEVRDNMVILADGSFRAVIACDSINFDLMSNTEREGVEYSYQNFLNSLNFPIQILVRSQRIDIAPYIDRLIDLRRNQDNMLLNVLMDDYIDFIDALSREVNIMDKDFYVVVPYFPQGDVSNFIEQSKGFFNKIFARPKNTYTRIDSASYEKAKSEIKNRVESAMSGLYQIGVKGAQLSTRELSELYYNVYNPDTAVREQLVNPDAIASTFVMKAPAATGGTPPTPPTVGGAA